MISIFYSYISRSNHADLLQFFLPTLSKGFQAKVMRYKRWQDTQSSLLGRLLLSHGLEKMGENFCEENLRYTSYNKPHFHDKNVEFNISHSGNIVVCALAKYNELGIDVEMFDRIDIGDFKSQMSENEWHQIIFSNDTRGSFFDYWTQKEAVIKAKGMGMSIPLKSFEVINNHSMIEKENFFLKEIMLDANYKCHLATRKKEDLSSIETHEVSLSSFARYETLII